MNQKQDDRYYSREELEAMKFRNLGRDVLVSRTSRLYIPEYISIDLPGGRIGRCDVSAGLSVDPVSGIDGAGIKDGDRISEDEIRVAVDVAVSEILPVAFTPGQQRVLSADEPALRARAGGGEDTARAVGRAAPVGHPGPGVRHACARGS